MQYCKIKTWDLFSEAKKRSPKWSLAECSGRFVECSGHGADASLSAASHLVLEAQIQGEHVAWLTAQHTSFFPPDMEKLGVDLAALPVIRLAKHKQLIRAADLLVRTSAFALVVIDVPERLDISLHAQSRLFGLARKHHTAIVALTTKTHEQSSLGSMISLRVQAIRMHAPQGASRFGVKIKALKDKKQGPLWHTTKDCDGPPGLR